MGLDMYLYRKTYVQRWDHQPPEHKFEVTVTLGGEPFDGIDAENINYITEQVAYWRKANSIHAWFVAECQDGVDDCREAYVSREQLYKLRDDCEKTLDLLERGGILPFQEEGYEPLLPPGGFVTTK